MSSVVVQIGQCGNQIGADFWKLVNKDKACGKSQAYMTGDGYLRSVHIDSEAKVVQRVTDTKSSLSVRDGNIICGKRGRGSNWALGYHGLNAEGDSHLVARSVEAVRQEAEKCSSFSGLVLMHSLSGGTGSGLGSRLCEAFRDEFPISYQLSCVVAPHASGESPLQSYNSLLCMAWLQRYCDGIMLFQNDEILHGLDRKNKTPEVASVSLAEMNRQIAANIAGVLLPADCITPSSYHLLYDIQLIRHGEVRANCHDRPHEIGVSIGMEPWEAVRSVCPMPSNKFMRLHTLCKGKVTWESMAGLLLHSVKKHDSNSVPYSTISSLCVARGDSTGSFPAFQEKVEKKLRVGYNYVPWNPFPIDFWTSSHSVIGGRESASMTIAANSSCVVEFAENVWSQARQKFDAKAFLHWYLKCGMETDDFEEAFETVAMVANEYTAAML